MGRAQPRVHEYGGGAYAVADGTVVFSHLGDDRVYRLDQGAAEPFPISPAGPRRFGGLVLYGEHVYAVREDHSATPSRPTSSSASSCTATTRRGARCSSTGTDFVSRPAVSADGRTIAWVAWDHPNMPWDSTRVLRAALTDEGASGAQVVAGG